MTHPPDDDVPADPQPEDIALEQATPEQVADLEAQSTGNEARGTATDEN